VTGFGLIGHLLEVLVGSGLAAEIRRQDVPVFPGVRELMRPQARRRPDRRASVPGSGVGPRGVRRATRFRGVTHQNMAHQVGRVRLAPLLPVEEAYLLSDPQNLGGLLMFVPEAKAEALCDALARGGGGRVADRPDAPKRATSRCSVSR